MHLHFLILSKLSIDPWLKTSTLLARLKKRKEKKLPPRLPLKQGHHPQNQGSSGEHRPALAGKEISSRMRAGVDSMFSPPLLANRWNKSITAVVSLMNQYLEMPLSQTAPVDAVFLRQVSYGALVIQEPFPHAPVLWCLWHQHTKNRTSEDIEQTQTTCPPLQVCEKTEGATGYL